MFFNEHILFRFHFHFHFILENISLTIIGLTNYRSIYLHAS